MLLKQPGVILDAADEKSSVQENVENIEISGDHGGAVRDRTAHVREQSSRRKALRVIPRGKQWLTVYRAHQVLLGGNRLLMLSVHPLEACRVLILLVFCFLDFDSEAFRASVGLFFGVWSLSFAYTKSKIWPNKSGRVFSPNLIEHRTRKKLSNSTAARNP